VQVPYIIYRNAKDEIIGIWFYDPEECEEVGRLSVGEYFLLIAVNIIQDILDIFWHVDY
jgi:hypothetical protein